MKVKKYNKEIKMIVDEMKSHYKKYGIRNIKYIETVNYYDSRQHIFDCILDGKKQRFFVNRYFNGLIDMKAYECVDINQYLREFGQEEALKILTEKFKNLNGGFVEIGGKHNG